MNSCDDHIVCIFHGDFYFRWEQPIPGSKPYWDNLCDELERRKEHVSESSYPPSPSPDLSPDPYLLLNCDESKLNECADYVVDPIVKISPPTPLRIATKNMTIDENESEVSSNSYLRESYMSVDADETRDAKLYEVSMCMSDFLKNNSLRSKQYCKIHRNAPPLKIFDDNLKRFLPKKKLPTKSIGAQVKPELSTDLIDVSKLHTNKSCPLRRQTDTKNQVEFDCNLAENKKQSSRSLKRPKTTGPDRKKAKGNFDQFLKVPEFPYVNSKSRSRYQRLNKNSESISKILKSNVDYMLSIPKLDDLGIHQSMISEKSVSGDSNDEMENLNVQVDLSKSETVTLPRTGSIEKLEELTGSENRTAKLGESIKPVTRRSMTFPRLSEDLSMALDAAHNSSDESANETKIGDPKLEARQKKDFLKVPRLEAISSYPSFSKLTPGDSVESEEGQKIVVQRPTGSVGSPGIENEVESSKRDFLKVPKLSMMSSYPSFTSLIPESLDSDDCAIGVPDHVPKISVSPNSGPSSELTTNCDVETSPTRNDKPRRVQSLKSSVRYAYRALKFITPNKNLDFQPQSYDPPKKAGSSSGSSDSSRVSKYSKFEPAIKLLAYEDVARDKPIVRSASSSTYGTVRSRLKQNASRYLGPEYVFVSSKTRPVSASTTIPSLTRSTSGPTLDFQEPVFARPSEKVLNKLPKMSIFPRRKYDKCFACLHKAFEEPAKIRRELPLAIWNAVATEPVTTFSESESSSISLPDVKDIVESQSDFEDNWTEVIRARKKSSMLDKLEWKSSKIPIRTNLDVNKSRQPEESQSIRSDAKLDNFRRNLTTKDSVVTNTHPRPVSLSSEHSKPSSQSGHSSESEEPQVQVKPAIPTSECFVSPFAPTYWAPSLEPLKSLKFRKPVSMHGRAVSITKTEDGSSDDDNANEFRSTRREPKLKATEKNQESGTVGSAANKSITKQPSIVAKIITSQLSTIANLTKKQSKVDLLSGDAKNENPTEPHIEQADERQRNASSEKPTMLQDKTSAEVERSSANSPLPRITEQSTENENSEPDKFSEKHLLSDASVSGQEISSIFYNEPRSEESETLAVESSSQIYSNKLVMQVLKNCVEENRTPLEMLEALNAVATQNGPFASDEFNNNPEIARSAKIAKNLMRLLIGSKKYLNPNTFSPNLEFSSPQTPLCNPRQLKRVLPTKTYNLVARILGMPENPVERKSEFKPGQQDKDPFRLRQHSKVTADSWDMIVSTFLYAAQQGMFFTLKTHFNISIR